MSGAADDKQGTALPGGDTGGRGGLGIFQVGRGESHELSLATDNGTAGDGSIRRLAVAERIIFERSGIEGMIGGQTADVEAEKKNLPSSAERLSYIHEKKTGALIAAAMLSGAILGGCGYDRLSGIEQMALALGLAFQIRDDILDVEGSEEVFGKPIGSDEKNAKLTYVSLYGLERAKAEVVRLTDEAHTLLDELPGDVGFLHGLFDVLIQRES